MDVARSWGPKTLTLNPNVTVLGHQALSDAGRRQDYPVGWVFSPLNRFVLRVGFGCSVASLLSLRFREGFREFRV